MEEFGVFLQQQGVMEPTYEELMKFYKTVEDLVDSNRWVGNFKIMYDQEQDKVILF